MAYGGFLVKVGEYIIPQKFIKADSYKAYVNMQDIDDYTDANGYLHRNAVELKALKVEFDVRAMLTGSENGLEELMSNIRNSYTNSRGRECIITAFIPEYNDYVTQKGYLADFQPQIYGTYGGELHYSSFHMSFIGGVYND